MKYAVINLQTNVIENTIVWDGVSAWTPPDGCYVQQLTNSNAGIGWSFVNNQFAPPVTEDNG